jgi:hypothetical protein
MSLVFAEGVGITIGMSTRKLAISIPAQTLKRAQERAKVLGARSLSAYISEAIDQRLVTDDLDALLAEMLAESGGPLSKKEQEAAAKALGFKKRRKVA